MLTAVAKVEIHRSSMGEWRPLTAYDEWAAYGVTTSPPLDDVDQLACLGFVLNIPGQSETWPENRESDQVGLWLRLLLRRPSNL